jgi:hypothetical protein
MITRVAILLSVTLALANAECFTRCVAERVDQATDQAGTPPCHSHPKAHAATPQHDLRPSAVASVQAGAVAVLAPVGELAARGFGVVLVGDVFWFRPPPLAVSSSIPLRV